MNLILYPDPILRIPCEDVVDFSFVRDLYDDMYNLMKFHGGCGLSAPQIGISQKFFIVEVNKPLMFINPVIISYSDRKKVREEGCLSLPNFKKEVVRSERIKVSWFDFDGGKHVASFAGYVSMIFQHEYDHCFGKLINDI